MEQQKKMKKEGSVGPYRMILRERFMPIAKAMVRLPTENRPRPWWFFLEPDIVQIIPILKGKFCVLNRQWKPGAKRQVLEFPAGYVESDDASIVAAAVRELREETGCVPTRLVKVAVLLVSPTNQPTRLHVFLAEVSTLTPEKKRATPEEEGIKNVVVQYNKIPMLIASGRIDSISSIAAYAAVSFRRQSRSRFRW